MEDEKMAKQTWYARDLGNGQGLVIEDGTGRHVAAVYDTEDRELVAAAPELLAALEECVTDGNAACYRSTDGLLSRLQAINAAARAAIAKTEGSQQ